MLNKSEIKCDKCNGTGKVWYGFTCQKCYGKGTLDWVRYHKPFDFSIRSTSISSGSSRHKSLYNEAIRNIAKKINEEILEYLSNPDFIKIYKENKP